MALSEFAEITAVLEDLRNQIEALSERVARLESGQATAAPQAPAVPAAGLAAAPPGQAQISEEELLVISAAVAAYLGVRVHIRQVRLIGSSKWAQEGRVSIQASHCLHP